MVFKKGDLVRALSNGGYGESITAGNVYEVAKVYSGGAVDILSEGEVFHMFSEEIEPVTHLTIKEFIQVVEYMGYGILHTSSIIEIYDRGSRLFTLYEDCLGYSVSNDIIITNYFDDIMNIIKLYASTPLELREEKEQLYTLELPNNDHWSKFYTKMQSGYTFSGVSNEEGYQTHFTQKEIDILKQGKNGELIKALKQKPVKENE